MAIYISGVKGLPEQVQANKEDIKQIKEDIANIDFDAIRELEAQVGENTQDINNLENGQGVQDQAINGLGDRVGTAEGKITQLESDTRKITYNTTDDETRITGTTRIAVIKNNRIGDDDSIITFGTANGIELRQGNHILNYDDQGKLYLDGVELSPAPVVPSFYNHNIRLRQSGGNQVYFAITIVSSINSAFTISDLASWLYDYGYTQENRAFSITPARYGYNFKLYSTDGINIVLDLYNQVDNSYAASQTISAINDIVREI